MTLKELQKLQNAAESAEQEAKRLDNRREQLAAFRVSDAEAEIILTTSRYGHLYDAQQQLNRDFTKDVAGDLIRVTEMRLEREARQLRNRARLLRMQVAAYLNEAEEPA